MSEVNKFVDVRECVAILLNMVFHKWQYSKNLLTGKQANGSNQAYGILLFLPVWKCNCASLRGCIVTKIVFLFLYSLYISNSSPISAFWWHLIHFHTSFETNFMVMSDCNKRKLISYNHSRVLHIYCLSDDETLYLNSWWKYFFFLCCCCCCW